MTISLSHTSGRLFAVVLLTVLLAWTGPSAALRPDPNLSPAGLDDYEDDESAYEDDGSDDDAEYEDEADGSDDEADDQDAQDADEADGESVEESDDPGHTVADDDDGIEYIDDYEDDSWATQWLDDDSDDAIPFDDENYDDDVVWEIVETAGDEDDNETGEDRVGAGPMLSVRPGKRHPPSGGTPRRPRNPDDDKDVVYSFGGKPVSALKAPWQAQILYPAAPKRDASDTRQPWQRQHYCGGVLIAPEWVLTAAHCINQDMVDLGFKVRLGTTDISRADGITYRIDRIVRHSQYNPDNNDVSKPPNMYANDIALIRIAPDTGAPAADPARISPIAINRQPLGRTALLSAFGWGVTGTGSANANNAALLRVDLQLMDTPVCQKREGYGPQKITGTVFCAAHPTQSTCRGDSGGPVIRTHGPTTLVGIVSWGKKKCAGDGQPGVYTRIDRYADWIEQAMKVPTGKNSLP